MQLRSNPDFMHDDYEMLSRVWRSIEYLCLTPGLRKKYAREVGIGTVPQHQISPNFSSGAYLGEVELEKSAITLKYKHVRYGRGKDMVSEIGCLPLQSRDKTKIIPNQPYETTLYCYKHMVIFMFKSYCSAQFNRVNRY